MKKGLRTTGNEEDSGSAQTLLQAIFDAERAPERFEDGLPCTAEHGHMQTVFKPEIVRSDTHFVLMRYWDASHRKRFIIRSVRHMFDGPDHDLFGTYDADRAQEMWAWMNANPYPVEDAPINRRGKVPRHLVH